MSIYEFGGKREQKDVNQDNKEKHFYANLILLIGFLSFPSPQIQSEKFNISLLWNFIYKIYFTHIRRENDLYSGSAEMH